MADWDTQAIQARIVRDARVPKGAQLRTIANMLPLLDRHMRAVVTPRLLEVNEDWLTTTVSIPVVPGTAVYRLPWRSLRILSVSLLDSEGRPRRAFTRATALQTREMRAYGWTRETGTPNYWVIESGNLRLHPIPDVDTYTLSVRYARRPGALIDSQGFGAWYVFDVHQADQAISIQSPSGSPDADLIYDVVRGTPPFNALADDALVIDVSVTGFNIWRVTFDSLNVGEAGIQIGDYMVPTGQAPFPQIPLDYIPVLEQSVVEQIFRDNGDAEGATMAQNAVAALMASAQANIEPRAAEPEVCVPHDW